MPVRAYGRTQFFSFSLLTSGCTTNRSFGRRSDIILNNYFYCGIVPEGLFYDAERDLLAIAKFTLCLPRAALSWRQPTWEGLGFSELVLQETHPCGSNFIQSIFETVQAGCINSVLVRTVLSFCDSIWEKYFLISMLNLTLPIFFSYNPRNPAGFITCNNTLL